MGERKTSSTKLSTKDKGDEALAQYLLPGEVFLTNARTGLSEIERDNNQIPGLLHITTAAEQAKRCEASAQYESVRVLDVAFSTDGKLLPTHAAIVVKPKPQSA